MQFHKYSLAILLLVVSISYGYQNSITKENPTNIKSYIQCLLPSGEYQFQMIKKNDISSIGSKQISEKEEKINRKYLIYMDGNGILENLYSKNSVGEYLQDEEELLELKEKYEYGWSKERFIDCLVNQSDSSMVLNILNDQKVELELILNFADNHIILEDKVLNFKDSIFVNNVNNIYRNKWKGYKWKSTVFPKHSIDSDELNKTYTLTIGQLIDSGKILIAIKKDEFYQGHKVKSIMIPMISK